MLSDVDDRSVMAVGSRVTLSMPRGCLSEESDESSQQSE